MKKIILVAIASLFCFSMFCQNTKKAYSQFEEEAKNYEKNNKWIHAIGTYMDIFSCPDYTLEERTAAYNRYSEISEQLKNGEPGFGKFNSFDKIEKWSCLIDEFDEYYENHFELIPVLEDGLKKTGVDYDTRKIIYSGSIILKDTKRFTALYKLIYEGTLNSSFWKNFKLGGDLKYSQYKDWRFVEGYWDVPNELTRFKESYDYEINVAIEDSEGKYLAPVSMGETAIKERTVRTDLENSFRLSTSNKTIFDKDGWHDLYQISVGFTVDSETSKKIEDGKAKVVFVTFSQNKCKVTENELQEFLKSEENFEFVSHKKEEQLSKTQQDNIKPDDINLIEEIKNSMVTIQDLNIQILKSEVTQEMYKAVVENNPSSFQGDKLPVETISWREAISFCNRLSIKSGLEPCYVNEKIEYIDSETGTIVTKEDFDKDQKKAAKNKKYTPKYAARLSVEINEKANGYRLPKIDDYRFIGEKILMKYSNLITDEYGWYNFNSQGKTHEVAQKKALEYSLYDLFGNVWEFTEDMSGIYYPLFGLSINESQDEKEFFTGTNSPDGKWKNAGFRIVRRVF